MVQASFLPISSKEDVFEIAAKFLKDKGLNINSEDRDRPWGGFYVLEESQIKLFKNLFFKEVELSEAQFESKLSPKLLIVAPNARLSWQYHFRRAELWKLIAGEALLVRSDTDEQGPTVPMIVNEVISLAQGERHRLVGSENWGLVAEIWMHTDPNSPSNEEDIVRVSDDYSRK